MPVLGVSSLTLRPLASRLAGVFFVWGMVPSTRFERATSRVGVRCAIQLRHEGETSPALALLHRRHRLINPLLEFLKADLLSTREVSKDWGVLARAVGKVLKRPRKQRGLEQLEPCVFVQSYLCEFAVRNDRKASGRERLIDPRRSIGHIEPNLAFAVAFIVEDITNQRRAVLVLFDILKWKMAPHHVEWFRCCRFCVPGRFSPVVFPLVRHERVSKLPGRPRL